MLGRPGVKSTERFCGKQSHGTHHLKSRYGSAESVEQTVKVMVQVSGVGRHPKARLGAFWTQRELPPPRQDFWNSASCNDNGNLLESRLDYTTNMAIVVRLFLKHGLPHPNVALGSRPTLFHHEHGAQPLAMPTPSPESCGRRRKGQLPPHSSSKESSNALLLAQPNMAHQGLTD